MTPLPDNFDSNMARGMAARAARINLVRCGVGGRCFAFLQRSRLSSLQAFSTSRSLPPLFRAFAALALLFSSLYIPISYLWWHLGTSLVMAWYAPKAEWTEHFALQL